jgi:ATP-dependent Clp protease adaptor protein ClpS
MNMLNLEHIQANSTRELVQEKVKTKQSESYCIVLYNDDHNSFQHVIQCLMEVCEHSAEQAEQCAWIVHYKGKYPIKSGEREDMMTRCIALLDRGLSAEVVLV